jgi:hypothetical protein
MRKMRQLKDLVVILLVALLVGYCSPCVAE